MAHLEHDQLWALAQNELSAAESAQVRAHLELCGECQTSFSKVQQSVALLGVLPEAPELPSLVAQRVGAKLNEHFDTMDAKAFRPWWQFSARVWSLVAAVAVLGIAGALLMKVNVGSGVEVAMGTPDAGVAPVAIQNPVLPQAAPSKAVVATVSSARKARRGDGSVAVKQTIAAGDTVTTETGGQLWLKLPDGSKAGLTSASQVRMARLEDKAVSMDLAQGNLALVIPHRTDRVLTVQAGDVQVVDLGTRFLVSRDEQRVLVAVEEGSVDVKVPGQTKTLTAGHAVTWSNGEFKEALWAVTPPQPAAVTAVGNSTVKPPESDTPPIPPPGAEPAANPNATANGAPEDEWAPMPTVAQVEPANGNTPPPNPNVFQPPPDQVNSFTASKGQPNVFQTSLENLEQRVRALGNGLLLPRLNGESEREWQSRLIVHMTDGGNCVDALNAAARWLADAPEVEPLETKLKRSVLTQQYRCMNRLGRRQDAARVEQKLRELP